jgi:hypothetical protein
VLTGLHIPDKLALVGLFYAIFTLLMALQLMFLIEPHLREFALAYVGPTVFWTSLPAGLFLMIYLSMVAFAFQAYTTIPASRGGGEPACVNVEIAESPSGMEVSTKGARTYMWHNNLLLLDDRSDAMYLAQTMEEDGSASKVFIFERPLIRSVSHHKEHVEDVQPLDGWKRLFSGTFWRTIGSNLFTVRNFTKVCP